MMLVVVWSGKAARNDTRRPETDEERASSPLPYADVRSPSGASAPGRGSPLSTLHEEWPEEGGGQDAAVVAAAAVEEIGRLRAELLLLKAKPAHGRKDWAFAAQG